MKIRKREIQANFVHLLFHKQALRGMKISPFRTRCVKAGEVHEILTSDQECLAEGETVNRVGFLGFIEIGASGVIECGDKVICGRVEIGEVVGFDFCHAPNHLNIIVRCVKLVTAKELFLSVEDKVKFIGTLSDENNKHINEGETYDGTSASMQEGRT